MTRLPLALAATVLIAAAPPLSDEAKARYPQPVRSGDLVGRALLQPIEAQPILGHVAAVTRQPDGTEMLVIRQGGLPGFGTRPVLVPLKAAALLGEYVALMDLTPAQLAALPTATHPGTALPPDEAVGMGVVRPFH